MSLVPTGAYASREAGASVSPSAASTGSRNDGLYAILTGAAGGVAESARCASFEAGIIAVSRQPKGVSRAGLTYHFHIYELVYP